MTSPTSTPVIEHSHVFLGADHEKNERRTWAVIVLCLAMMGIEIVGGAVYGSIALMADGLHMSTHAGALLLTALVNGLTLLGVSQFYQPLSVGIVVVLAAFLTRFQR